MQLRPFCRFPAIGTALFALLLALPATAAWELDPERSWVAATVVQIADEVPVLLDAMLVRR
ncbi:MAG: hypothetical protein U5L98_15105 [Halomonas sp.]|uniref:hypothetical protein n=1 Tax=Halomonas sp. TaxID=1486246 RepID=UPI002ACDBB65|nr:hypothetical protein [Halomonas sp.]MDZ7853928.1 hypothetical protein [Halomonas sp.]